MFSVTRLLPEVLGSFGVQEEPLSSTSYNVSRSLAAMMEFERREVFGVSGGSCAVGRSPLTIYGGGGGWRKVSSCSGKLVPDVVNGKFPPDNDGVVRIRR